MTDLTLEIEPSMFPNSVAHVFARPRQLDKKFQISREKNSNLDCDLKFGPPDL
jgi:hypothetical protein